MIIPKHAIYIILMAILPLIFFEAKAQSLDEQTYRHKMQLMDSLSFYKMHDFDTLYHVYTSQDFRGNAYMEDYYGWMQNQVEGHVFFLDIHGKRIGVEKKEITEIKPLSINKEIIDSVISRDKLPQAFVRGNFADDWELALWLYKQGKESYSKRLLLNHLKFTSDTDLRNGYGSLYHIAMLESYSDERDYKKAIAFGEHLSNSVFKGYEYQNEAIALTNQLKNSLEDFKDLRLPDSLAWNELKQKLSRKEQILYLAGRLRLLNCIQPGQPSGISYDMYQYSVPVSEARKLNISYWEYNARYTVINPFTELLRMKLNLSEVELLFPWLLTDSFIPSYNYHRDFFPERNLHRLSWVIETLIFEITNKRFFDRFDFDALTPDKKKTEVEKIRKWCDDNARLSPVALTIKELKTANAWRDFYAALETAEQQKNDSLLSIIKQRFNDFNDRIYPSSKAVMAKTMYEKGGEKDVITVRKWATDTTDKWVRFWTSMFLIKYDKGSYQTAMNSLEDVLKQCDGRTYYPNAINTLLSVKDARAFKLAEGILDKSGFQQLIYWDYYEDIIRKLLRAKSDYTFNFLVSRLDNYTVDEMKSSHKDNDHMITQNDSFVLVIDELKNDTPKYYSVVTNVERIAYIEMLDKWFKVQYALLKEGKPNELKLEVKGAEEPATFIDTYYR